jgi:8-oxo-dGTP pyrophosphatase MutT (NUDIX family)
VRQNVQVETSPDRSAEWWNTSDVASFLGVKVGTVSSYRLRGQMPAAEMTVGRTQLWRPSTITAWHEGRPRPGVGGRPPEEEGGPRPLDERVERKVRTAPGPDDTAWRVHGRRELYDSPWIKVGLADVELPDGQRFEHHVVWLPAAAMTAVLNDAGTHVLLMWRHRFVPDVWNWELPGGLIDGAEAPVDAAGREVEEETGFRPRSLEHLVTFEPMIGMVNCPHHVYLARGAERAGDPAETTEMQRMEWVPLADVPTLIAQGSILNSGTLVALLHVLSISGPRASSGSTEGPDPSP